METAQNGGSHQIQTDDYKPFFEISPILNKQTIGSCSSMSSPIESRRELGGLENKAEAAKMPKSSLSKYFRWEIRWMVLKDAGKEWLLNPKNLALLIWGIAVAVSGAILFLLMAGLLNRALPTKKQRDFWYEVNNQIINGLFTLMCLYEHPKLFYHLSLLIRWKPEDIVKLRKVYCKDESYKPHERAHIMVVVLLLQLTIFGQYAVSCLNWVYKRSERPAIAVDLSEGVSIVAAVAAALYLILSPLRKDYEAETDLEAHADLTQIGDNPVNGESTCMLLEKKYSFLLRDSKRMEPKPEWQGGLFDCSSDHSVAVFSTFCGFCVFGWNMERLGFGNMYIHIVTFILFCMAPFCIFILSAMNIHNEDIQEALAITGLILCAFGLLYGGYWRIQMRKRFGLPGNGWCCGQPNVTDLVQWLFCSVCSLCQEVRTGNFYEVYEELCPRQYFGQDPLNQRDASARSVPLGYEPGSPDVLPPAVNWPSRVNPDMLPLNEQASVPTVSSPVHYSVRNGLPRQLLREGATFPLSNSRTAESHITISPTSETEDAHQVAALVENSKTDSDPMDAPIPQYLER